MDTQVLSFLELNSLRLCLRRYVKISGLWVGGLEGEGLAIEQDFDVTPFFPPMREAVAGNPREREQVWFWRFCSASYLWEIAAVVP